MGRPSTTRATWTAQSARPSRRTRSCRRAGSMIHTRLAAEPVARVPTLLGEDGVARPRGAERVDEEVVREHVALVHQLPRMAPVGQRRGPQLEEQHARLGGQPRREGVVVFRGGHAPWSSPAGRRECCARGACSPGRAPGRRPRRHPSATSALDAPLEALGGDVVRDAAERPSVRRRGHHQQDDRRGRRHQPGRDHHAHVVGHDRRHDHRGDPGHEHDRAAGPDGLQRHGPMLPARHHLSIPFWSADPPASGRFPRTGTGEPVDGRRLSGRGRRLSGRAACT